MNTADTNSHYATLLKCSHTRKTQDEAIACDSPFLEIAKVWRFMILAINTRAWM